MNRRTALTLGAAAGLTALIGCAPATTQTRVLQPGILDIVDSSGQFATLAAAIRAAGLTETLRGPGPFTLFAPTDAAFAALPPGTLDSLLLPANRDRLASILTYHVVPTTLTSDLLGNRLTDIRTAQGQFMTIDGRNGVRIGRATVTQADILASNGVVHRIDRVLLAH